MSPPVLERITGSRALYELDDLLFLLANPADAPAALPLDGTWGAAPATVGYYLFVSGSIVAPAVFETQLRQLLPPPAASSIAWAAVADDGGVTLAKRIAATPVSSMAQPVVAQEVVVTVGATQFVLPAGTPLVAMRDGDGHLTGFTSTAPQVPGGGTPNGIGTDFPFFGVSGGCITFTGLFALFNTPTSATMQVVNVQLDPLRPTDPSRTDISFTGTNVILQQKGSGYVLQREPSLMLGGRRRRRR